MASPFVAPPAGTPVEPSTSARYYYRRQIFSRNPVTGTSFKAGTNVNFNFEASGGHYFVPQESRIVAKMKVFKNAQSQKLERTVRFATDPVTSMFSSAQLSVNGTTVESHANNVDDISRIQLRTEQTKAGADGPGSAGLLSFNQQMLRENNDIAAGEIVRRSTGGTPSLIGIAPNGDIIPLNAATDTVTKFLNELTFHSDEERSDKHQLLIKNCSAISKPGPGNTDGAVTDGGNGATATRAGTSLDGTETDPFEISSPLGQMFTFCRQTKAFLPNMAFQFMLTISDNFEKDAFFTKDLPVCSVPGVNGPAKSAIVPKAAAAPHVVIEELYLDAMFAVPSVNLPPPTSLQIPYQAVSVYTRNLSATTNFTENFTSIPASIGALVLGVRRMAHGIDKNRELYAQGTNIKTLSMSLGSLQLPIPAYQINIAKHEYGRLFADWLSFTGGSASNGVGADSLTEFATSPLFAFRVLQEPGAYASTATIRMQMHELADADDELVVWAIHQRVFEAFWSEGESFPSRVVVDDVLN